MRCPPALAFIFADPPLAPGENETDWTSLCNGLADALRPATAVDWLRLRDVACGVWESLRMQRYRDCLLRLERSRAASELLTSLLAEKIDDPSTRERAARSIVRGWIAGRPAEKREMAQALAAAGVDEQTIVAGAFMSQLETHERLERLRRRAEDARDAALGSLGAPRAHQDNGTTRDDLVIEAEVLPDRAPRKRRAASKVRPDDQDAQTANDLTGASGPAEVPTVTADRQPDLFG